MIFDPELACDLIREELTERVEKATELDGPIPYGISAANVLAAKSPHSIEHFSAMLAESIRMLMVEINKVQTLVDQVRLLKDYVEREAQPDHVLIYDEIRTDQFCTGELMKDILRLASAFHLYLMRTSGANEEAKEGKRVVAVRRRGVEQAAKKKKAQGDESRSRLAKLTIDLWRQKTILVNRPHPTARAVETLIKAANRKKAESRSDLEKMAARLGIGRARIRDIISQEMVPTGLIGRQLRLS